jgi:hypothetical protein
MQLIMTAAAPAISAILALPSTRLPWRDRSARMMEAPASGRLMKNSWKEKMAMTPHTREAVAMFLFATVALNRL